MFNLMSCDLLRTLIQDIYTYKKSTVLHTTNVAHNHPIVFDFPRTHVSTWLGALTISFTHSRSLNKKLHTPGTFPVLAASRTACLLIPTVCGSVWLLQGRDDSHSTMFSSEEKWMIVSSALLEMLLFSHQPSVFLTVTIAFGERVSILSVKLLLKTLDTTILLNLYMFIYFFYMCVRGGVCARMCNFGVYTCQKIFLGTYSINFCLIHLRQNVSPQSIICKRLSSHLLDSCIEKWLDNEGLDTLSA